MVTAMANTLLDDMKSDFADVMLNTNEFAETATFYPANGDVSRSIVMHVNRTQAAEDGIAVRSDRDTLIVSVLKDSSNAKGGIPIEELESGLRPTLVRASDFNWNQHAADQIDDQLVASPTGTFKNLFDPAYADGGQNTWNTSCWALNGDRPLDLTGLSPFNDDNPDKAGTAISPRHLLFASHVGFLPPPIGTEMLFVDQAGDEHTRTITGRTVWGVGNFGVAYLDSDLPSDITFYKVLPDDFATHMTLQGLPVIITDKDEKALVGIIEEDHFFDPVRGFLMETGQGTSPRDNYWEDLVLGDSGHPTFLVLDGELILVGVHVATAESGTRLFDVILEAGALGWQDDINTIMADLDTASTGYQLTQFSLTRPLPGRFVFSGDILSETPHSWTLRFIRQKGYQTGIDGRRD